MLWYFAVGNYDCDNVYEDVETLKNVGGIVWGDKFNHRRLCKSINNGDRPHAFSVLQVDTDLSQFIAILQILV